MTEIFNTGLSNLESLRQCEEMLLYSFTDKNLLQICLTHASAARSRLESNERIEFLGDAILGAVICEALYDQFPDSSEGELTRIKSVVVSRSTCAKIMRAEKLEKFLLLGKGISTHLPTPFSVLATALEAIIGGIYLDGGYEAAKEYVLRVTQESINNAAESTMGVNHKSLFQQRTQRTFGETPIYKVVDEKGPDHSKCFKMQAIVGQREFAPAWGNSKKSAEQRAAQNAISELDGIVIPHVTE